MYVRNVMYACMYVISKCAAAQSATVLEPGFVRACNDPGKEAAVHVCILVFLKPMLRMLKDDQRVMRKNEGSLR